MDPQELDQFFLDTFTPVALDVGTQYHGLTLSNLLAYTNPYPTTKVKMSKADSVRQLTDFLTSQWPNNTASDSLNRMRIMLYTPGWGPDTLIKILPDLDMAFFGGRLRGKIKVSWEDSYSMRSIPNFVAMYGATVFDEVDDICSVYLNRDMIYSLRLDPREEMLQTLLHEMVHAWHCITCFPNLPRDHIDIHNNWESDHGWHFRWILNLLDLRTLTEFGFSTIPDWEDYYIENVFSEREDFPF